MLGFTACACCTVAPRSSDALAKYDRPGRPPGRFSVSASQKLRARENLITFCRCYIMPTETILISSRYPVAILRFSRKRTVDKNLHKVARLIARKVLFSSFCHPLRGPSIKTLNLNVDEHLLHGISVTRDLAPPNNRLAIGIHVWRFSTECAKGGFVCAGIPAICFLNRKNFEPQAERERCNEYAVKSKTLHVTPPFHFSNFPLDPSELAAQLLSGVYLP